MSPEIEAREEKRGEKPVKSRGERRKDERRRGDVSRGRTGGAGE